MKEEETYLRRTIPQASTLIEFGCGQGRCLALLEDKCSSLVGIDNSLKMIEYCQNHFTSERIKFHLADASDVPLENNRFDVAICVNSTLGNIYDEKQIKTLKEMVRVVRPKGSVLISVYSENALETQLELYRNVGLAIKGYDENFVYTANLGFKSERFSTNKIKSLFSEIGQLNLEIVPIAEIGYIARVIVEK